MAEFSKFVHVDLNAGVRNVPVEGGFFRRDALANRLGVIVSKDHEPVTLTGIIKGFVKYPPHDPPVTGTDVTIYSFNGTIDQEDQSRAYIDLPAEAYYYNGPITVAIRNDVGDKKTVLATFSGYVSDSTDGTDGIPLHSLPDDIDQFISYLSQLETDIANVQTAAAQATRVNITQSKTDHVITVQTTGRIASEDRTTTITEPTATLSKEQDGPYTLSVTDATGTTSMTIPDPAAEVKKKANRSSVTSVKTAYSDDGTVTIDDALDEPAKLTLSLEPKQDLHGYDKPWVGGAGKNLLERTGESKTINGITFTVNDDGSVTANGTATSNANFYYANNAVRNLGGCLLSGCPDGGTNDTYFIEYYDSTASATIKVKSQSENVVLPETTNGHTCRLVISIRNGYTANNLTFYPMIRLATETDPTYEPYSNICPITGFDTVNITRTGKNLIHGWGQIGLTSKTNLIRVSFETGCCYTLSLNSDTLIPKSMVYYYDENKIYIGRSIGSQEWPRTIYPSSNISTDGHGTLIENGVKYIQFVGYSGVPSPQTAELLDSLFQIELGENVTDYEEPKSKDISIGLLSITGSTLYGGTVTVNEDGSGTVAVDRAMITFNGSETLLGVGSNDHRAWRYILPAKAIKRNTDSTKSSHFMYSLATAYGSLNKGEYMFVSSGENMAMCIPGYTAIEITADDVKKYLSDQYAAGMPVQITYSVEPITYQLSTSELTTLLGTNHVWTDSGCEFTLDYRIDKYGKIINDLIRRIEALEAGT